MRQIKRKRTAGLGLLIGAMASGLFGSFAAPVQAQDSFGNQVIQFPVDTTVEFEFKESHGAYQSSIGIVDLDTRQPVKVLFSETKPYDQFGTGQSQTRSPGQNNIGTSLDFVGTVQGGTVQNQLNEFTFQANKRYAFYLESVSPTGQTRRTVLSSSSLAAVFDGSLNSGDRGGIVGSRIAWDDDGLPQAPGKDDDFDDFVIEAGGYLIEVGCPPVS
ncbi:hypothetical protein [Allocoleopsis franciscana]|uniref:DUF4114 domain-containing protein n=1 Tax=Allocoleopsis franciscana PCC 7113 TaxID=1173027 RepID=K9WKM6_9CYAN|nr:hypothetical protein [Allocoleopsis franciscana]AFZ20965.1 hypothetical protein Mic7113_5316 [Allocoleopsis franciscana PCC 7113]